MDYITLLSKTERQNVCAAIPVSAYREFFQRNPTQFRKISTKRLSSIRDNEIIPLVQKNLNKTFIWDFINGYLDNWMKEVDRLLGQTPRSGPPSTQALMTILPKTPISDAMLYLKLARLTRSAGGDQYRGAWEGESEGETDPAEVVTLRNELQEANAAAEAAEEEHRKEVERLTAELNETRGKLSRKEQEYQDALRVTSLPEEDLAGLKSILHAADLPEENGVSEDVAQFRDYPFYSVCVVNESRMSGSTPLRRVYDLEDGVIQDELNPEAPDRPTLWDNENDLAEGYVGVWGWVTQPNFNPAKPDFVRTTCYPRLSPIEVCFVPGCRNMDELAQALKDGVSFTPSNGRVLFTCRSVEVEYTALFCREKELLIRENSVKIRPEVCLLPVYRFHGRDLVSIGGRYFHRSIFLGIQESMYHLKDPLQVVRERVIARCSWTAMKNCGLLRRDTQAFREFLLTIPDGDLYQDIAATCFCTLKEAEQYTKDFVAQVDRYLGSEDLEAEILSAALERNQALMERCIDLGAERWKEQNSALVKDSERKSAAAVQEARTRQKELEDLTRRRDETRATLNELTDQLSEKEKMVSQVEEKVARRIAKAREDAASFIAEMAFVQPASQSSALPAQTQPVYARGKEGPVDVRVLQLPQMSQPQAVQPLRREEPVEVRIVQVPETPVSTPVAAALPAPVPGSPSWLQPGEALPQRDRKDVRSTKSLMVVLRGELIEAGVAENSAAGLACWLYAAFINRIPLLLAGPNGRDIADAFCSALFGTMAPVFTCQGEYAPEAFQTVADSRSPVVAVEDPFHHSWVNHLPELFSQDRFFLALHPFSEDLMVEPRSLYNYMQPVLTELVVENRATRRFSGGQITGAFRHLTPGPAEGASAITAPAIGQTALARTRLQNIMTDLHRLLADKSLNADYLYGVFPCAYAIGRGSALVERLSRPRDCPVSKDTLDLFRSFLAMDE